MRALVMHATVNGVEEWRVYFNGEIIWHFDNEHDATILMEYLNKNFL